MSGNSDAMHTAGVASRSVPPADGQAANAAALVRHGLYPLQAPTKHRTC